jgi:hypothetical protein
MNIIHKRPLRDYEKLPVPKHHVAVSILLSDKPQLKDSKNSKNKTDDAETKKPSKEKQEEPPKKDKKEKKPKNEKKVFNTVYRLSGKSHLNNFLSRKKNHPREK